MEEDEGQPIVYILHTAFSYYIKCIDDSIPEDVDPFELQDWVEEGRWYQIIAMTGSIDLNHSEYVLYDFELKYILKPSDLFITFPSSMFDTKDTHLVSNN